MTITEATEVNVVLSFMLIQKRVLNSVGAKLPKGEVDVEAFAAHLADRAHKVLNAGFDGNQVRRLWKAASRRRHS